MFLRLLSASLALDSILDNTVVGQQSIRISNDLYGNDVMSAYELAKGCTRPLVSGCPTVVPDAFQISHDILVAKRKLTLILRSRSVPEQSISPGGLLQVFVKLPRQKRGNGQYPSPFWHMIVLHAPLQSLVLSDVR